MRIQAFLCIALLACLGVGCFGGGDGPPPVDRCEVSVTSIEQWDTRRGGIDVAYRVRGEAGSPAVVWLAAKAGPQNWISGKGVNVGPGPFEAIVDLRLTGMPNEFRAVLEVAGRRCADEGPRPGG